MPDAVKIWDPNEWEQYIMALLRRHYGPGDFVEVPAKHRGDFGLEGFSTKDGCAYQCYAAEEPVSTATLYEKQRDKTTRDLGKFINNHADLVKLFGATKIRRWILMVPRFESANLIQHLTAKSQEVLAASLPYAQDDFRACVETDASFEIEKAELYMVGIHKVAVPLPEVDDSALSEWQQGNSSQLETLGRKLATLLNVNPDSPEVHTLRRRMVRHLLEGQNALQHLKLTYPQLYQDARVCKSHREHYLDTWTGLMGTDPSRMFDDVLKDFHSELLTSVVQHK